MTSESQRLTRVMHLGGSARGETSYPIMELRNLDVYYGDFHAVRDVSLDIGANQITAFIGPSGCGKSTVLRCLNRTNDLVPSARVTGVIDYRGHDLYGPKVDPIEVRRRVGMVFQKPNPFPKSIFDNIAYGPRVTGMKLNKSETADLVEHALTKAGLWTEVKDKLDQSGFALSGGQQQRVAIVRALAMSPEVLLLDEITSALDPELVGEVLDVVRELKGSGITMLIATHEMNFAREISDRVCFLASGLVAEQGSPTQIFSNPTDERTKQFLRRVQAVGKT